MIACLTFPYFASAVERRKRRISPQDSIIHPQTKTLPGLVIGGQPWEPQAVYAYSQEVAKLGVKPGMSLRLAHFLSPLSQFLPANPPLYQDASAEIIDLLTGFTHLVEPELFWSQAGAEADHIRMVTTGLKAGYGPAFGYRLPARYSLNLESLPAPEATDLAKEMGRIIRRQTHLAPSIGLAENQFVAHIAAVITQANHARPVLPGETSAFLAGRSIRFLALEKETSRRLSLLGIRTLGQLVSLPVSSAATHLGLDVSSRKALKGLHEMISGNDRAYDVSARMAELLPPLQPIQPETTEHLSYDFEPPITDRKVLERAINQASSRLAGRLQKGGNEGRTFSLSLEAEDNIFRETNSSGEVTLTTSSKKHLTRRHPTADPAQINGSLRELLHEALTASWISARTGIPLSPRMNEEVLEQDPVNFNVGVIRMIIKVTGISPAVTGQLTLFDPPRASGKLKDILSNLLSKYKRGIFYKPALADINHPLMERRFQLEELVVV